MKKLLAILILALLPLSANGVELDVKDIQISPLTKHQCVSNDREFAGGEFIVEFTGTVDSETFKLANGHIPHYGILFDNWYHLVYYLDCKGTIRAFEELKKVEGMKRVEYNYIMRIMPK